MAAVLHRTTLEYRARGANPAEFDAGAWIINPDLTAVAGVPLRHWRIVGDDVLPMTSEQMEAVELPLVRAAKLAAINAWWDQQAADGIDVGNGLRLRSDSLDATQLQALLLQLMEAPDEFPTMVTSADGIPAFSTAGQFRALSVVYATEFAARRSAWAAAMWQASQAATVAAVNAVEVPTHA